LDILDDQKVAEVVERSYALKLRAAQIVSQKKNGGAFRRSRAATTAAATRGAVRALDDTDRNTDKIIKPTQNPSRNSRVEFPRTLITGR
jgi:hypothetical protein